MNSQQFTKVFCYVIYLYLIHVTKRHLKKFLQWSRKLMWIKILIDHDLRSFFVFYVVHVCFVSHNNKFLFLLPLHQKLRSKNQEIKEVIDKLRNLIWDVNTMMALKPSWLSTLWLTSGMIDCSLKIIYILKPDILQWYYFRQQQGQQVLACVADVQYFEMGREIKWSSARLCRLVWF